MSPTQVMDRLDALVAEWHNSTGSETLADYLGMTEAEYDIWAVSPISFQTYVQATGWRPPVG